MGFQRRDGCIEGMAIRDFFENQRYGYESYDEAEVMNYLTALDKCVWGANAKPEGLKQLQEEASKKDIQFSIPTSLDEIQDLFMDGLAELFSSIFKKFKVQPRIATRCQRALYLLSCLDVQVKINQNETSHKNDKGGSSREGKDEFYFDEPHLLY